MGVQCQHPVHVLAAIGSDGAATAITMERGQATSHLLLNHACICGARGLRNMGD
jgi:hypothetical protein